MDVPKSPGLYIALHIGAGNHSPERLTEYKLLCEKACIKATKLYKRLCSNSPSSGSAACLQAITTLLEILESSALTNAGYGSSLTLGGHVECEAGIMCGSTHLFGGVGAVSLLEHPISVAAALLDNQIRHPLLPGGRVPPSVLVSTGAHQWANMKGFSLLEDDEKLISPKASHLHSYFWSKLEELDTQPPAAKKPHLRLDTIGAVCMNENGDIFAAASSGGIPLKYEGRLGQSCVYGAGCWASQEANKFSVGFCNSGSGELIVRCQLARKCGQTLQKYVLQQNDDPNPHDWTCPSQLLQSIFEKHLTCERLTFPDPQRLHSTTCLAGTVGIACDMPSRKVEIVYCHSTPTLVLAYHGPSLSRPQVIFSELSSTANLASGCVAIKMRH